MPTAARERNTAKRETATEEPRSDSRRAPSLWRGAISFGMVSIPVRLYSATTSHDITFNLLHEKCNSRMKQVRWCPRCDRAVPWDEVVKGYEYARDRYVRLTEEDFQQIPVPSKHIIDLESFVEQEEIDPIHYEKSYLVEPEPAGRKAYRLLADALVAKKKLAVAKVAIRDRERLCVLRPYGSGLLLETLYYPDEIRAPVAAGEGEPPKRELDMALMLIDSYSEPFDPRKYRDTYRDALERLIEARVAGREIVMPPALPESESEIDLFEGLRRTLEARKRELAAGKARAKKAA